MSEPVENAIQKALIDAATAFATAQGMATAISYPNVAFAPPASSKTAKWLKVDFLPAPSFALGVDYGSHDQHYGLLQVGVFVGEGAGDPVARRIAAAAASFFKRGTILTVDGVSVEIYDIPRVGSGMQTDVWWMVPVSIPYKAFATA